MACFRHFMALMRKNFIIYLRTPGCSLFELLGPIILFIGLTIVRNLVPVTPTDSEGMQSKKLILMPGAPNIDGVWSTTNDDNRKVVDLTTPLTSYSNYTSRGNTNPDKYDFGNDWYGPQFYAPTQCIRYFDWAKPPKASPIIAIIGE